jgi:hypothetical protein
MSERISDLTAVLYFLLWAAAERTPPMYAGHDAREVFDAACRLLGVDQEAFLRHAREAGLAPEPRQAAE